jgi:flagellar basal body-associated protein FliL
MADATIQKLNQLERKIEEQINKARRSQVITIVVGVVFVVVLLGYFGYMSKLTRESLEPEGVSSVIVDNLKRRVQGLSGEAEKLVRAEAPKILNDMITNAVDRQMPQMRTELETAIKTQTAALLQKYEDEVYKGLEDTLAKYGENIREFATQLTTAEGTAAFEESLFSVIDEALRTDEELILEVQTYGEAIATVDAILNHLVSGNELTEEEAALLRLIQVIREITKRAELDKLEVDLSIPVDTPGLLE